MKIKSMKTITRLMAIVLSAAILCGCGRKAEENMDGENTTGENVIITETGEVIEKATPSPEKTPEPAATQAPSTPTEVNTEEQVVEQTPVQDGRLQIVFLGDSIFAAYEDGTDVPARTAAQCGARGYNLAIGGTTAAVADKHTSLGWDDWTSISLVGVVHAIVGHISTDVFEGYDIKEILDAPGIDFSQTDYFVIQYGVNDFLSAVPMSDSSKSMDLHSYVGALRYAVSTLKGYAPDATIVLCSPTYARFYNGDWMIGDGNSINNGYGTLYEYKDTCEYVANEYQTVYYNAYEWLGIDGYTADEYLEDGIHLTDKGRQLYADALTKLILETEETKNN